MPLVVMKSTEKQEEERELVISCSSSLWLRRCSLIHNTSVFGMHKALSHVILTLACKETIKACGRIYTDDPEHNVLHPLWYS